MLAQWQAPRPPWLDVNIYGKLAVHPEQSTPPEKLSQYFSANVGFTRECFSRFGLFREDLGVVGDNPMSGEDTELFASNNQRRRANRHRAQAPWCII